MIACIDKRSLPLVIKMPQAVGGLGTFLVHTEPERQKAKETLRVELQQTLQGLDPLNNHLHPCCLVIQEYIPGKCMAISFFVTQKGRTIFICCTDQFFAESGMWTGGSISYPDQTRFEEKYSAIIQKIGNLLCRRGYYGAVGADIVTDSSGRHLVIDLNVRISGSYNLGCLKGHFGRRGLLYAGLHSIQVLCTQSEFRGHFSGKLEHGSLIVTSWTSNLPDGSSLGSVIIAAPNYDGLEETLVEFKSEIAMINRHCASEVCRPCYDGI